jgi:hypothetical protein
MRSGWPITSSTAERNRALFWYHNPTGTICRSIAQLVSASALSAIRAAPVRSGSILVCE